MGTELLLERDLAVKEEDLAVIKYLEDQLEERIFITYRDPIINAFKHLGDTERCWHDPGFYPQYQILQAVDSPLVGDGDKMITALGRLHDMGIVERKEFSDNPNLHYRLVKLQGPWAEEDST